jgi:opacity protein-like surface antigen
MRKIAAAVMFALIAGSALAQDHVQQYGEEPKEKTAAQKADDNRAERAYQRSINNVPDQKPADPWGTARGDDASKKSAAPAKPAVKQSSKAKSSAN